MKKICKECVFDCKGNEYCTRDTPAKDIKTSNTIILTGDEEIHLGDFESDDMKHTITFELTEEAYNKIKKRLK